MVVAGGFERATAQLNLTMLMTVSLPTTSALPGFATLLAVFWQIHCFIADLNRDPGWVAVEHRHTSCGRTAEEKQPDREGR